MSEVKGVFESDVNLQELLYVFKHNARLIESYFHNRMGRSGQDFDSYMKELEPNLVHRLASFMPTLNFYIDKLEKLQTKKAVEIIETKKTNVVRGPW